MIQLVLSFFSILHEICNAVAAAFLVTIDVYRLTNLKAATFHKLADSLGRAKI